MPCQQRELRTFLPDLTLSYLTWPYLTLAKLVPSYVYTGEGAKSLRVLIHVLTPTLLRVLAPYLPTCILGMGVNGCAFLTTCVTAPAPAFQGNLTVEAFTEPESHDRMGELEVSIPYPSTSLPHSL